MVAPAGHQRRSATRGSRADGGVRPTIASGTVCRILTLSASPLEGGRPGGLPHLLHHPQPAWPRNGAHPGVHLFFVLQWAGALRGDWQHL